MGWSRGQHQAVQVFVTSELWTLAVAGPQEALAGPLAEKTPSDKTHKINRN